MSEVYLGNPNLKKANTQIEFTEDQIIEFLKCKEDASHLIVSSIDTIRGLDEDMWTDLRAVLLERYKGR